jgi:hypothetical protein
MRRKDLGERCKLIRNQKKIIMIKIVNILMLNVSMKVGNPKLMNVKSVALGISYMTRT